MKDWSKMSLEELTKLYEKGELGISKIAEILGMDFDDVYEYIMKNAKRIWIF